LRHAESKESWGSSGIACLGRVVLCGADASTVPFGPQ